MDELVADGFNRDEIRSMVWNRVEARRSEQALADKHAAELIEECS